MVHLCWFIVGLLTFLGQSNEPYREIEYTFPDGIIYENIFTALNPENGDIYLLQDSSLLVSMSENNNIDTLAALAFEDDFFKHMMVSQDGSKIFFIDGAIGRVHEFDLVSGMLRRTDTSFNHRNMYSHAGFIDDENRIFAMGGYGLWTYKNLLIYFDPETGQWDEFQVSNNNIVIQSEGGHLFADGDTLFYIVEKYENPQTSPLVYQLDLKSRTWSQNEVLTSFLKDVRLRAGARNFQINRHTFRSVDKKSKHYGFITNHAQETFLNILDYKNSKLHKIPFSALEIYDVRSLFFSERLNKWIVLGHEFPTNMRNTLMVKTFAFDPENALVTTIENESITQRTVYLLGGLSVLMIGIVVLILFNRRKSNGKETAVVDHPVVELSKDDEKNLTVKIHGQYFNISSDPILEKCWQIIFEMADDKIPEILLTEFDDKLFSSQTHPSQISRNRKKLISIINEACSTPLITEEKSKTDKRFKVLSVKLNMIKITGK